MTNIAIIPQLLHELPMQEALEWEDFQTFCSDVLSNRMGVQDCRDYLEKGNKQDGIDIYAVTKNDDKKIFAQCKLEKYLSPQDVDELITKFLDGKFTDEAQEFILCTSFDLSKHRDETQTIDSARNKLKAKKIELVVWDKRGLSQYLRNNPDPEIINRYFGDQIAKAFYGAIWDKYIDLLRNVPKQEYNASPDHISRTVIAYDEYAKKKNGPDWFFSNGDKEKSLKEVFETPGSKKGRRIVLLSTAGFGKTEELNQLAAYYSSNDKPIHPVKYILKDYEGQQIETLLSNYHQDWRSIKTNTLLLLFDGLDEIKDQFAHTFINHLNAYTLINPDTNILVTSRYNFYDLRNQQLRDFDVYLIQPLSGDNIDNYISEKLTTSEDRFRKLIKENHFTDYIQNPYYLTRLVRFFADETVEFPKNKSRLFKRILFERLEKDSAKFNIAELKEQLYPAAEKIAFCMTRSGRSSLTKEELKIIIPDGEKRRQLRNFCILNLNESGEGSWSFEHKNLQEYLTASFLTSFPFDNLRSLISFSFNSNKLLPRFLNTVSFLFELLDSSNASFIALSQWLQEHQPELFVRFEKERLQKEKRQQIFKTIFLYYKSRHLTLRTSSNFSLQELADFAEIDGKLIEYLGTELKNKVDDAIAYDILQILSTCKKPFLFRPQLEDIYFPILNSSDYSSYVKGQCVLSIMTLDINDKSLFDRIISSGADIEDYEIRRKLMMYLESAPYFEDYADLIIESVRIYGDEQMNKTYSGINNGLVRLILKFVSPEPLKKVLRHCLHNKQTISRHNHHKGLRFDRQDISELLNRSAELYKQDPSFLRIVYKIYATNREIEHDEKFRASFAQFFKQTCGLDAVFRKLFKYRRVNRNVFHFADAKCIDFLIEEFKAGRLAFGDAVGIRNLLSWVSRELCLYYIISFNEISDRFLEINDEVAEDAKLYELYQIKNQQLLLDKNAFIAESCNIFDAIDKEDVGFDDIHGSSNKNLIPFQYSMVKDEIGDKCIGDDTITKEEFINIYSHESYWEGFVIEQIVEHLKNSNKPPLMAALREIISNWLSKKLIELDFSAAVIDSGDGVTLDNHIEFVKEVFLLIDVEAEDAVLLKLLETDFSGILSGDENASVSGKVLRMVKDQSLFRKKVFENIQSGKLANWVLTTHFGICHQLKYNDCLGALYQTIITSPEMEAHEKKQLTEFYLSLGGEINDFADFLTLPPVQAQHQYPVSWEWFLIEGFIPMEPVKVAAILLEVYRDPAYNNEHRLKALSLLLKMGYTEALQLWADYIREHHKLPFEHEYRNVTEFLKISQSDAANIDILANTLKFAFENKLFMARSYESIPEVAHQSLIFLTLKSSENHQNIKTRYEQLITLFAEQDFIHHLYLLLERLNQRFYENHEYQVSIQTSSLEHTALLQYAEAR